MTTPHISKMHQRVMDSAEGKREPQAPRFQENTFWDDARNSYIAIMTGSERVEGQLAAILTDIKNSPEKLALVPDQRALAQTVTVLTRDLRDHFDRINAIYAEHKDRSGGTMVTTDETGQPDVSDHMKLMDIQMRYSDAMKIYDANIVPVFVHILEQIGVIDDLIAAQKAKAAQDALDPNVITDVQVKTNS